MLIDKSKDFYKANQQEVKRVVSKIVGEVEKEVV